MKKATGNLITGTFFCDANNCAYAKWYTTGDGWNEPKIDEFTCTKETDCEKRFDLDNTEWTENPNDDTCPDYEDAPDPKDYLDEEKMLYLRFKDDKGGNDND